MGDQITLEDWLNEEIEVCDKCLRACCWHGLFMCDDSAIAGTIKKKRRDLVALGLEHSDYMVVDGESEHLYVTPKPVGTCNCEYVKHEDHLKAIAEAKKELFTREQVSEIVDYCFHKHASSYMGKEAEVAIEEAVEKIQGRRVFNIEIIGEE